MRVEMAWQEFARHIGQAIFDLNHKRPPWEPAHGCGKRYAIEAARAWEAEHPEAMEYYRKEAEHQRTWEAEHKEELGVMMQDGDFDIPL